MNKTDDSCDLTQFDQTQLLYNNESRDHNNRLLDKTADVIFSNFAPCCLYDCRSITQTTSANPDSLYFIHLNVCSLYKHFDELNELIISLPFSPVVICLSEVRLRESLT